MGVIMQSTFPGGIASLLTYLTIQVHNNISVVEQFFQQHTANLDSIAHALNSFPVPFSASHPNLVEDTIYGANCHPILLQTLKVVQTRSDGSCLYNAISICLTGSEQYTHLLRLLSAHALFKYKPTMLAVLIDSWFSTEDYPMSLAERHFRQDVCRALAISAWGGEAQLLALCWLFDRPIFVYNSFYEGSQLLLADTRDAAHLAQRFLNFEHGTRHHLLFCTASQNAVLQHGDVTALPSLPIALVHVEDWHWVACIYRSSAIVTNIPIPRCRLLRGL